MNDYSRLVLAMTPSRLGSVLAAAALILCGASLSAHDGLTEQIAAVTAQISRNPGSFDLVVRRAELYREDHQWKEALADLDRAERLDRTRPAPDLVRAHVYLDTHRWQASVEAATRFLARQTGHADALIVRGRARAKLGDRRAAAADFTRALETRPLPGVYLERAHNVESLGPRNVESALRGLDEGITRLGPIVTLELEAVELELRLKRYDAALARLDRVSAQSARKDTWLARRAAILERAGRLDEARVTYTAALDSANSQRERIRQTRASTALIRQLRADIARLATTPGHRSVTRRWQPDAAGTE